MADGSIGLPPDSSGQKLDTEVLTVATVSVNRQRLELAGAGATEIARVMNTAPAGTEMGAVVRPIPSGTQMIQGQQSALQTGTIIAATSVVGPFSVSNYNLATVGVVGTYAGVTFLFEGSYDGTNYFSIQGVRTDAFVAETGGTALTNTTRAWDVPIGGFTNFRVRATAWTSGTATVGMIFQTMPFEPSPTVGGFPFTSPASYQDANPAVITTAATTQLFAAAGAGLRWCLTDIAVSNSHASTDVTVTVSDSGGTIWQGLCKAGGGGFALAFSKPKRQPTANVVVNIVTSAAGNVLASAGAFSSPT